MNTKFYAFLAAPISLISLLTGCVYTSTDNAEQSIDISSLPPTFSTNVITNDRSEIGKISLYEVDGNVFVQVKVKGISPGKHGVHFHAVADCSDGKFLNTTGHINPAGHQHGLHNTDGPDNADLPNLIADENGEVDQVLRSPRVTLGSGTIERPSLFDADGSALVIHANEDDQVSQPIGGAGPRIGCAEIK